MLYALNKPMKGMRWESFVQPKKEEHNLALWFNIKGKIVLFSANDMVWMVPSTGQGKLLILVSRSTGGLSQPNM